MKRLIHWLTKFTRSSKNARRTQRRRNRSMLLESLSERACMASDLPINVAILSPSGSSTTAYNNVATGIKNWNNDFVTTLASVTELDTVTELNAFDVVILGETFSVRALLTLSLCPPSKAG